MKIREMIILDKFMKFILILVILLLVGAGVFSFSVYMGKKFIEGDLSNDSKENHYEEVNNNIDENDGNVENNAEEKNEDNIEGEVEQNLDRVVDPEGVTE